MAGAGSSAAGLAVAGNDVVTTSPSTSVAYPTDPVYFDVGTKSNPRDDATGLLRTMPWVDQAVNLALGVQQGKFTSQSSLGNQLRAIKRAAGPTLVAEVTNAVKFALKRLLDQAAIGVLSVNVSTPFRGVIQVDLGYVNLVTSQAALDTTFVF